MLSESAKSFECSLVRTLDVPSEPLSFGENMGVTLPMNPCVLSVYCFAFDESAPSTSFNLHVKVGFPFGNTRCKARSLILGT